MLGKPGRPGFGTLTPYLMVVEVDPLVEFLEEAFDATVTHRSVGGQGGFHVEVEIGDAKLMLGGGNDSVDDPTRSALFLYVEDVDAVYRSAVEAGAEALIDPTDGMFDEARGAGVRDPFGNDWYFGRYRERAAST